MPSSTAAARSPCGCGVWTVRSSSAWPTAARASPMRSAKQPSVRSCACRPRAAMPGAPAWGWPSSSAPRACMAANSIWKNAKEAGWWLGWCCRTFEELHRHGLVARALHRRQALPDAPAVVLADDARVADHQHAAVVLVADQASRALLQRDDGARQLVFHEGVSPLFLQLFDARRQHRVVRRGERQLVDDDQRQRLAAHVHALPERLASEQHRVAVLPEPA